MSTGQPGDVFGGSLRFFFGGVHVDVWRLKLYNNQFLNGHFNWMIPNHDMKNGCFTKHPFQTGCLGYQVIITVQISMLYVSS